MSYINPAVPSGTPNPKVVTLGIIRISFLAGVLAFGAVAWFVNSRRAEPPAITGDHPMAMAMPFVLAAALIAIIALRVAAGRAASDEQRSTMLLVGWAVGEMSALAGGAFYLLSGDPKWYVGGLFVFLLGLVLLPLRRD